MKSLRWEGTGTKNLFSHISTSKHSKDQYQLHNSSIVFTISQKYIFNIHQITTSCGKFNIFLARTRTENAAPRAPKHAISSENFFFWGGGIASAPDPSPGGNGYPLPHSPIPSLLYPSCASPRIQAIFAPLDCDND